VVLSNDTNTGYVVQSIQPQGLNIREAPPVFAKQVFDSFELVSSDTLKAVAAISQEPAELRFSYPWMAAKSV
jgi:hypothetical protein